MSASSKLLPNETVKALATRSNLWGAWLTFHVWAVIIASAALFILFPNPFTFVFAFLMIGSRQHGMAILMHEAAHGMLFKSRKLNDFVGQYLLAAPYSGDMLAYRHYHLKHHLHTQTEDDPDLPLSAKFPVTKASLARKFLRDITGLTFIRLRLATLKGRGFDGSEAFPKGGAEYGAADQCNHVSDISASRVLVGLFCIMALAPHDMVHDDTAYSQYL